MQFIIIHDKKLIIFWSPKCGCSTLKTILAIYFNIHNPIKYSHIHLNEELDELIDKNEDNLKYKNYDLVFLIRNPYDRLASGFMNKYVNITKYKRPHYTSPDNCKSFHDFCHILLNNPKAIDKHHFEPQTSGKGWHFYNFLGKPKIKYVFDTKDVNEIKKLLDLSIEDVKTNYTKKKSEKSSFEKLYFLNYENLRKKKNQSYSNLYNSTLKKIVYEIYKNDFDFFNNVLNMNYSI